MQSKNYDLKTQNALLREDEFYMHEVAHKVGDQNN